jgi:hypothetical protein
MTAPAPARSRKRYCPVCRQFVIRTARGNIWRHRDSMGRETCPMSGEPYELADLGRVRYFSALFGGAA